MGGIEQLAETVATDMEQRLPGQRKTQRGKLALLVATMLQVRSANLMDVAACLPRPAERLDSRYQWIKRFLANAHVISDAVMAPYGREVLARLSAQGQTVVLLIDQTKVSERHQVVMVAVRLGGRALPLAWRVKETQGAIGFAEQRAALEAGRAPAEGHRTDRETRAHQRRHGARGRPSRTLDHRPVAGAVRPHGLRLRLALGHRGHVLRFQEPRLRARRQPDQASRTARPPHPGHGVGAVLGGVDRHVGCRPSAHRRRKKPCHARPRSYARSLTSLFKRGLRRIHTCLHLMIPLPPLWTEWLIPQTDSW